MRFAVVLLGLAACGGSDVSRAVGARCDVSADCDDRCLAPSNDYPDGFCTLTCDTDDECPSDAACVSNEGGVCLFVCDGDPSCAFLGPSWTCQALSAKAGGQVMACRGG
jgi:hypothetical protein